MGFINLKYFTNNLITNYISKGNGFKQANKHNNNNTSSLMRLDHCYALDLLLLHSYLKKKSFREGAPHWPIFAPILDPPWSDLVEKAYTHMQSHKYFHPTKFRKHP